MSGVDRGKQISTKRDCLKLDKMINLLLLTEQLMESQVRMFGMSEVFPV